MPAIEKEHYWVLIFPAVVSAVYGPASVRVMHCFGYEKRSGWLEWFVPTAVIMLLTTAWCISGFPLPVFYLLIYISRCIVFFQGSLSRTKKIYLVNLFFLITMGSYLIVLGVMALAAGKSMVVLLENPALRAFSISGSMLINIVLDIMLLVKGNFAAFFNLEADSIEVRPFTEFLLFGTVSLMLDSILCVSDVIKVYMPLFSTGSSVLLLFLLFYFIRHIYQILMNNYVEDENVRMQYKIAQYDVETNKLRALAYTDSLTGAYSRRYAKDQYALLTKRKRSLSVVFIDLDRLKKINDQEGHYAGDNYLIQFVRTMKSKLGKDDVFARVGGDEFVILMADCKKEDAFWKINAIREAAEKEEDSQKEGSFSFGIVYLPAGDKREFEELVREADRAMYIDKQRL